VGKRKGEDRMERACMKADKGIGEVLVIGIWTGEG
jgi:hypothetical protein